MSPYMWLGIAWVLVTISFIILLICRSRLESKESDWIDLTGDEREERAIQQQKALEKEVHKFDKPIWALAILSIVLLLAIAGFWLYSGIMHPPPPPE